MRILLCNLQGPCDTKDDTHQYILKESIMEQRDCSWARFLQNGGLD